MQNEILDLIGQQYGCTAGTGIYRMIDLWQSWWQGKEHRFHEYWENAAFGRPVKREMYRLHMAKKVCEDWASLLFNDKTYLQLDDPAAEKWVGILLDNTDFWRRCNHLVEKAFALGSGACLLRVRDLPKGCTNLTEAAGIPLTLSFDFVDAGHILPISAEEGRITEAAFISEIRNRGETILYAEIHTKEEDGYVIRNRYFGEVDGSLTEIRRPGMPPEEIRTGCPFPFFSILTPNIHNAVDEGCGLGQSIFADAIDCLKGVDLAFNNFCRDLKLGGKKVFINQSLVNRDDNGNLYTPDDVAQQLFVTIGDTDLAEHPMITEHNPELRTADNAEAVQSQLDYLSFRCGLGTHHYTFGGIEGRARLTATQYMGERQDMMQNAVKHQKNVEAFLRGVVHALLWCAAEVYGLPADPEAEIAVTFDDSYFTDTESQRSRDLDEVKAGILTAEEYRRKWIEV